MGVGKFLCKIGLHKGEPVIADDGSDEVEKLQALDTANGGISWNKEKDGTLDLDVDTSSLTDISKIIAPDTAIGSELDSLLVQGGAVAQPADEEVQRREVRCVRCGLVYMEFINPAYYGTGFA